MLDDMPRPIAQRLRKLYNSFRAEAPRIDKDDVPAHFRVPFADATAMINSGITSPFSGSHGHATLFFAVLELAKLRRRPIFWSRLYLENSDYQSEFSLDPCAQYTSLVNEGTHAAAFDLQASYTQVKHSWPIIIRYDHTRTLRMIIRPLFIKIVVRPLEAHNIIRVRSESGILRDWLRAVGRGSRPKFDRFGVTNCVGKRSIHHSTIDQ